MHEELKYQIGLTLIPGIGDVLAKNLVSYCGSAEAVFRENKSKLLKIPGIGETLAEVVRKQNVLKRAEEEIKFIEKFKITPLFYTEANYPKRLKHCADSPVLLYYRGNADLNTAHVISIVGTRDASNYGKTICEKLIVDLIPYNVLVVSGLAYGVDICAHKAAVKNNVPTVGVLAHGLDRIYPAVHRATAEKMLDQGGLLTDFPSGTNPDMMNFPKRNRIVAGMADATIVIESKKEGGSLITADIANSYSRDVFAFPGRVEDDRSAGCNQLIKNNKAALIESAEDIVKMMGWELVKEKKKAPKQASLLLNLTADEEIIVNALKEKQLNVDDLSFLCKLPASKLSMALLNLEMSGVVKGLPGKVYVLC